MQEHREKIDSRSRKRRILIADDELINREILGAILQDIPTRRSLPVTA